MKTFYNKNGYILFRNLLNKSKTQKLKNSFCKTIKYLNKNKNSKVSSRSFSSFDKHILNFKKNFPEKNNFLYKNIPHYSSFIKLFEDDKVRTAASKLLNTDKDNLIICEHQFRMDYPDDQNHILNWHQDASFYKQDSRGNDSLVCLIYLQKTTKEMGSTLILPGSNKLGILKYKKSKKSKKKSGQRTVNLKNIKNKPISIEYNEGDVTFYSTKLLHKSGYNISNKIRYSAIARIFKPLSSNYKSFLKISNL